MFWQNDLRTLDYIYSTERLSVRLSFSRSRRIKTKRLDQTSPIRDAQLNRLSPGGYKFTLTNTELTAKMSACLLQSEKSQSDTKDSEVK